MSTSRPERVRECQKSAASTAMPDYKKIQALDQVGHWRSLPDVQIRLSRPLFENSCLQQQPNTFNSPSGHLKASAALCVACLWHLSRRDLLCGMFPRCASPSICLPPGTYPVGFWSKRRGRPISSMLLAELALLCVSCPCLHVQAMRLCRASQTSSLSTI